MRPAQAVWSVWGVLGAPPVGRRVSGSVWVFVLGAVIGAAASVYAVRAGINFDYGDSMAHLTIARRIFDNKAPGLQQLGTVWLPLPHLLLIPLSADLWMWHTGAGACVLGSVCLGAAATGLFRSMARLGYSATGRVVGLGILLSNVSLIYACTMALTEPVLIASIVCTIAGLAGWAFADRPLSGGELAVFAGIPLAAGVLSRYEAWALVVSGSVFVAVVALRRGEGWRRALAYVFSYAVVPAAGIIWWLAYNMAWYRNPLEFLTGPYSAAAFTEVFIQQGQLTTKGNPGQSFRVLCEAIWQTAGLVTLLLAAVGLALMTLQWGLSNRALLVWLGGTSSAFLLFSLTTGQHIMVNNASLPPGLAYNNRYVLSAIPWFALLGGYLTGTWRASAAPRPAGALNVLVVPVVAVLLAVQVDWWMKDPYDRLTVITEGDNGHTAFREVKKAARWLGTHYDGGSILMDESSDKLAVAPVIGLPLSDYYNRATGGLFDQALENPATHARWVFMHVKQIKYTSTQSATDHVTAVLAGDPQFHARYALVYRAGNFGIYRRIDPGDPQ